MDSGRGNGRDDTRQLSLARRADDRGLPDATRRTDDGNGPAATGRRQPARRALGPRQLGLQPRGAVSCQPGICRAANELPRLDRLRAQVQGTLVQAVGTDDAERHYRRRTVADFTGNRRLDEDRHIRRQLRRLCDAGRPDLYARPVRLRSRLRGRVESVHVPADDPSLLETDARHDVRNGGRPAEGQHDAGRLFAGAQRRQDQGAAAGRAGSQRPARQ